jgi:fido (protein-threonine AMPylation protein)
VPKQITEQELQLVQRALARLPQGGSVEAIRKVTDVPVTRRTLQRRLAFLVKQQKLTNEGRGRGSRYHLSRQPEEITYSSSLREEPGSELPIPLSPESEAIRELLGQSLHTRKPVGYQREFLESYRPNETFYLPLEIRQRLAAKGKSPERALPAGTYIRQIFNRLLIDLSWNSSRLEGNTYSLLETERLLDLGVAVEGKNVGEAQMILNHKAAIELLADQAAEIDFNRYTIQSLHALLSDNLLSDPGACGRLRTIPVGIGGTVFHPMANPHVIEECFQQLLDSAAVIKDPFEQAFFVMVQLPYLQPFEDVNKRVSRLAANIPLIQRNLCPLSFIDVPKQVYIDGLLAVYEFNRIEVLRDVFIWAYERSCARYSAVRKTLGEPDPFRMRYRVQMAQIVSHVVREGLGKQEATHLIKAQSVDLIPPPDRERFVEVVETEIMSLHEGNIARYRLRPSEYQKWLKTWH